MSNKLWKKRRPSVILDKVIQDTTDDEIKSRLPTPNATNEDDATYFYNHFWYLDKSIQVDKQKHSGTTAFLKQCEESKVAPWPIYLNWWGL